MKDNAAVAATTFDRNDQLHLKHLTLKGLQPKTVEAYSRAIRRLGVYFADLEADIQRNPVLAGVADDQATVQRRSSSQNA